LNWITDSKSPFDNFAELKTEAGSLFGGFKEVVEGLGVAIKGLLTNPVEGVKTFLGLGSKVAVDIEQVARSVGRKVVGSVLDFLSLAWKEFGEKIGNLLGNAAIQFFLSTITGGLAAILERAIAFLAEGSAIFAKVANAFKLVGAIAERVYEKISDWNDFLFDGLIGQVKKWLRQIGSFFNAKILKLKVSFDRVGRRAEKTKMPVKKGAVGTASSLTGIKGLEPGAKIRGKRTDGKSNDQVKQLDGIKRGKINANIEGGVKKGYAGHHLIPIDEAKDFSVMQKAAMLGYDINRGTNGIALPTTIKESLKTGLPLHSGRHLKGYTMFVNSELRRLQNSYDFGEVSDEELSFEILKIENKIRKSLLKRKIYLQNKDPHIGGD
jgi:hypothetical protein